MHVAGRARRGRPDTAGRRGRTGARACGPRLISRSASDRSPRSRRSRGRCRRWRAGLVGPRHAALDREVDLERARTVAVAPVGARDPRRAAGRRRSRPPRRARGRDRTASALGELGQRRHPPARLDRAAVLGEQPRRARRLIACEPPRATGQPKRWQAQISAMPTDELIGRVSGLNACAATPPNSALAFAVVEPRARAGSPAPAPGARSAPAAAGASAGAGSAA